jgi:hypothetical protein
MILSFYQATLQLIFLEEQGKHLFPASEPANNHYIRITGNWDEGLRIYRSNEIEYNIRKLPGVFYKLTTSSVSKGQIGLANIGWGILGPLKRANYTIPTRVTFDVEMTFAGEHAVIKVPPLSEAKTIVSTRAPKGNKVIKVKPSAPVIQPVIDVKPILQAPTSPTPAEAIVVPTQFVQPEPVIRKIIETGDQSVIELRGLSQELNKTLLENPTLYVVVREGRLYLEEETVEYEEF